MSEPSLREFQQWMKSRIRPSAQAASSADNPLNPQRGIPGSTRMQVYAEGYTVRIREALAEVFEAVRQVLGEATFAELAESYATQFPSHDYNLSLAGRHLPEFLNGWPKTAELPFLPDLARLEWLVCVAFHAFDEPALSAQQQAASIAPSDWENLQVVFQPSVGAVASSWPILDIWEARSKPRESVDIPLVDRPQQILVYRHQLQVKCAPIDWAAFQLLESLLQGQTLGQACGKLAESCKETPPVAGWFSNWMQLGLIARCEPVKA